MMGDEWKRTIPISSKDVSEEVLEEMKKMGLIVSYFPIEDTRNLGWFVRFYKWNKPKLDAYFTAKRRMTGG